jgi:hypothetical protein
VTESSQTEPEALNLEDEGLLNYEDLEPLEGNYKLAGYPSKGINLMTVLTLGLGLAIFPRWGEEGLEQLKSSVNKKIEERYGDVHDAYLTGTGKEIVFLVLADEKINLLRFDKSDEEILEINDLKPLEVLVEQDGEKSSFLDREKKSEIIELVLNDSKWEGIENYFRDIGYYFYRGIWDDKETIEELKRADIGLKENFRNFSPYEFEEFIADLFEKLGYSAWKTSDSGDYGVDVVAEKNGKKYAIQVKRHKITNKVGSPTVRDTLGSKHKIDADKTVIVTTSYFTKPAWEQAENSPIELWNKNTLDSKVEDCYIRVD